MTNTINRQKLLVVSSKKPVLVLYNPVVGTPPLQASRLLRKMLWKGCVVDLPMPAGPCEDLPASWCPHHQVDIHSTVSHQMMFTPDFTFQETTSYQADPVSDFQTRIPFL